MTLRSGGVGVGSNPACLLYVPPTATDCFALRCFCLHFWVSSPSTQDQTGCRSPQIPHHQRLSFDLPGLCGRHEHQRGSSRHVRTHLNTVCADLICRDVPTTRLASPSLTSTSGVGIKGSENTSN
ncbi:hypothetical protein ILYODFUR_007766 [Ilyodon furcidens]|uniref:Uncharacterized protein n=1 Tax=Ilyodon furcidens TaxID=33524 RepID=A0ABV0USR6_9TELE